jgi:hypothetical protein
MPDPRRAASVVYALPAIRSLAVAAMLATHVSGLAMAEGGTRQDAATWETRGFPDGRTPCQATLQRLLRQLDGDAVTATRRAGCGPAAAPTAIAAGPQGVAIAGKAQRGRRRFADPGGPVHAVRACCHDHGIVLAHAPITAGPDQAAAALTVAPTLLARIDWPGRGLTGDALCCQRARCPQGQRAGGADLRLVKENQGTRYRDIQFRFAPPAPGSAAPLTDCRVARTVERGHGRSRESRALVASTARNADLAGPGVAPVCRRARTWRERGKGKRARHDGITRLAPEVARASRLRAWRRGHGAMETRLHRRQDINFGEAASLGHGGPGPPGMALRRDAAIRLLHRAGVRHVASR